MVTVSRLLLRLFFSSLLALVPDQALSSNQDLGLKVAAPVGTLVGQLLFGWLADKVGRKRMFGVELILVIIATFGQTVSGSGHAVNIIGVFVVWRFLMGVGVGGDCPLSAIISSEFASTRIRGRMMNAVFVFQGWGNFGMRSTIAARYSKQTYSLQPRHWCL
ncbi:major facilitator superfamily domain-containing protein [Armillaria borealis]|uniref:Major facilitator superfamily domain-containing protein n=1 Tax=Armillaria borealis TaxID=47425 RepID=A0AA39MEG3_9AGAR|nr:major facilitator superfamily domain-containing protein [Armillaria borealis]